MSEMKIKKDKIQEWLPQIIILLFIIVLPIFVFKQSDTELEHWKTRYYFQAVFAVIAFYGNYLFIVPHYFFSGKRIRFFLVLLGFAVSLFIVFEVLNHQFGINPPPKGPKPNERHFFEEPQMHSPPRHPIVLHPRFIDDALFIILVLGFSTGIRIVQRLHQDENQKKEMEKAHVETELAFLKNQINPHFFFNSLNNIYALIEIDGKEAQKAVEQLSGLMRYLIYESDVKMVKLEKEFEFTRNYIDLMKQRLSPKVKLLINIQQNIPDIDIPPLIFIPFIENAFKHGVSYRGESFINIALRAYNDKIDFICKNSIHDNKKSVTEKGGVGITNIKKRLELLYGKNATLIQHIRDNSFIVELIIPTKMTS